MICDAVIFVGGVFLGAYKIIETNVLTVRIIRARVARKTMRKMRRVIFLGAM